LLHKKNRKRERERIGERKRKGKGRKCCTRPNNQRKSQLSDYLEFKISSEGSRFFVDTRTPPIIRNIWDCLHPSSFLLFKGLRQNIDLSNFKRKLWCW
jgi:hypothetical protein